MTPALLTPRRKFLIGVGSLLALGLPLAACTRKPAAVLLASQATNLASLVDTIIPQDDFAGALQLGLDQQLLMRANAQPARREQLDRLLTTLGELCQRQYRQEFHQLDIDQREQLLTGLLTETSNIIARRDLQQVRNSLLSWYYQSEAGARSLAYRLPAAYPAYPA